MYGRKTRAAHSLPWPFPTDRSFECGPQSRGVPGTRSEDQYFVRPQGPLAHLVEGAASSALDKVGVLEAAGVHAGAAYSNCATAKVY